MNADGENRRTSLSVVFSFPIWVVGRKRLPFVAPLVKEKRKPPQNI